MGKEENSDCDDNDEDMSSQFQLEMKDDIDDVESKDSFYDKPALGPFERDMVQANRARARAKMTPKTTMKLEVRPDEERSDSNTLPTHLRARFARAHLPDPFRESLRSSLSIAVFLSSLFQVQEEEEVRVAARRLVTVGH